MRITRALALTSIVATLCHVPVDAVVLEVPSEYATITAAIDAATNGDTVLVAPGTYSENLDFVGKQIVLTSHYEAGGDWRLVETTVIDGSSPADPASASTVAFRSGEGAETVLQGFTITGGGGTEWVDPQFPTYTWRGGGGIFIFNASPTIRYNVVTANQVTNNGDVDGGQAGGLLCYGGDPLIHNNLIHNNRAEYGGGLVVDYSGAWVRNTVIRDNTGGESYGGGGVWTIGTGNESIIFENCTILSNTSPTAGGAMYIWSSSVTVRNSIIWGNQQAFGATIRTTSGGSVEVAYSVVDGGWEGVGNINADPLFVDSETALLASDSPCADSGDSDPVYNDPEDSQNPGQALWPARGAVRSDMGAYGGPGSMYLGFVRDPSTLRRIAGRMAP